MFLIPNCPCYKMRTILLQLGSFTYARYLDLARYPMVTMAENKGRGVRRKILKHWILLFLNIFLTYPYDWVTSIEKKMFDGLVIWRGRRLIEKWHKFLKRTWRKTGKVDLRVSQPDCRYTTRVWPHIGRQAVVLTPRWAPNSRVATID